MLTPLGDKEAIAEDKGNCDLRQGVRHFHFMFYVNCKLLKRNYGLHSSTFLGTYSGKLEVRKILSICMKTGKPTKPVLRLPKAGFS
jgi:hypothetical protein